MICSINSINMSKRLSVIKSISYVSKASPDQKLSNANTTFLDKPGFRFMSSCLDALESRGLEDQGMYRVVGVASKVTKLMTMGLDRRRAEQLNLQDNIEWETKTVTSAIKTFLRNLPGKIFCQMNVIAFK